MPQASEAAIVSDRCQEIAIPDVSPSGALRATQNFEGFSVTADRSQAQGDPARETPDDMAGTGIDTTVPHSARIWNYWLGGKDNYQVDRMAGDQFSAIYPGIIDIARADRVFLGRVVRFMAGEAGVRQFLDVGTGLPTADNTHQVAQRVAPESRIVYVANDPLVLTHARALLTSTPEGTTDYIHADMHDPGEIIAGARQTLDFDRPIAITMLGVLWHVMDDDDAYAIVNRLVQAMPSGRYLAINHPRSEERRVG